MKTKSIYQYFIDGFKLATASLDLFLISFLFALRPLIHTPKTFFGGVLDLILFVFTFISLGFWASIPLILTLRQEKKDLNYKEIWKITKQNTKRIIIPFLLIVLFAILCLVVMGTILVLAFHGDRSSIGMFFYNIGRWPGTYLLVYAFIVLTSAPASFSSVFFSVQGMGFFKSVVKSFELSFKHPIFLLAVIFLEVLIRLFIIFIPSTPIWDLFFRIFISYLFSFVLICSALKYYQD